ncbi:MAG: hypothetical protein OEY14_03075 [Myxococcales bacterium]|nr:hypothetical protein [Myxococcales bacterium]
MHCPLPAGPMMPARLRTPSRLLPRACRALGALAICGLGACASSPGRRPAEHADFNQIAREEAQISHAIEQLRDPQAPCTRAEAARARLEQASDALCELTERLADADAEARCARGRRIRLEGQRLGALRCAGTDEESDR